MLASNQGEEIRMNLNKISIKSIALALASTTKGKNLYKLRVELNEKGYVVTAFPIKQLKE